MEREKNLCDVIAANRGWHPLGIGQSMVVGFLDGTEYTITRNQNRYEVDGEREWEKSMAIPLNLPDSEGGE